MEKHLITSIPIDELRDLLRSSVREVLSEPTIASSSITKEVMTAEELAEYLGASVQTIYNKKNSGEIPYCKKVGLRFIKKEIDQWLIEDSKSV